MLKLPCNIWAYFLDFLNNSNKAENQNIKIKKNRIKCRRYLSSRDGGRTLISGSTWSWQENKIFISKNMIYLCLNGYEHFRNIYLPLPKKNNLRQLIFYKLQYLKKWVYATILAEWFKQCGGFGIQVRIRKKYYLLRKNK